MCSSGDPVTSQLTLIIHSGGRPTLQCTDWRWASLLYLCEDAGRTACGRHDVLKAF